MKLTLANYGFVDKQNGGGCHMAKDCLDGQKDFNYGGCNQENGGRLDKKKSRKWWPKHWHWTMSRYAF